MSKNYEQSGYGSERGLSRVVNPERGFMAIGAESSSNRGIRRLRKEGKTVGARAEAVSPEAFLNELDQWVTDDSEGSPVFVAQTFEQDRVSYLAMASLDNRFGAFLISLSGRAEDISDVAYASQAIERRPEDALLVLVDSKKEREDLPTVSNLARAVGTLRVGQTLKDVVEGALGSQDGEIAGVLDLTGRNTNFELHNPNKDNAYEPQSPLKAKLAVGAGAVAMLALAYAGYKANAEIGPEDMPPVHNDVYEFYDKDGVHDEMVYTSD